MLRLLIALTLFLLPGTLAVQAESGERELRDMPVVVYYCESDPGRLDVSGGKGPDPQTFVDSGQCTPAERVALTFVMANDDWDFESDVEDRDEWDVQDDGWFARCDIDAEGKCALNSPVGFDILLGVVLHESTVKPGYVPAFFQPTTHNYTEFAGWGLALIPEDIAATPEADVADHQTLALKTMINSEPGNVLTEWKVNDEDTDTYLATNTDGWVSNIVAADDVIEIELVNISDSAKVDAICSANDDASIAIDVHVDGNQLKLSIPETVSDIRCDVTITEG